MNAETDSFVIIGGDFDTPLWIKKKKNQKMNKEIKLEQYYKLVGPN